MSSVRTRNNKKTPDRNRKPDQKKVSIIIAVCAIVLSITAIVLINGNKSKGAAVSEESDIVITKSEITETVTFIPARVGTINMEVMAVKASDGTIRTAFNTCQVCNGSQNCGNRFSMDMIEEQRGGCNPVPIDEKTENDETITISKDFITQNKGLFTENWKTR